MPQEHTACVKQLLWPDPVHWEVALGGVFHVSDEWRSDVTGWIEELSPNHLIVFL